MGAISALIVLMRWWPEWNRTTIPRKIPILLSVFIVAIIVSQSNRRTVMDAACPVMSANVMYAHRQGAGVHDGGHPPGGCKPPDCNQRT